MKPLVYAGLLVLVLAPVSAAQTKNWPQFRGAMADGLGEGATQPETWSTTENVVWKTDLPGWGWSSPVIWEKRIFGTGLLTCSNAKTGETIFPRERLETGGGRFYASPWAYNGKLFCLNEDRTTWVVEDGPKFNVIRKNSLNDFAWATPAIAQGSLFIRTYTKLYRL